MSIWDVLQLDRPLFRWLALLREGTVLEQTLKTALVVRPEFLDADPPRYDEAARATGVTAFGDLGAASDHLGIPVEASAGFVERLRQSP